MIETSETAQDESNCADTTAATLEETVQDDQIQEDISEPINNSVRQAARTVSKRTLLNQELEEFKEQNPTAVLTRLPGRPELDRRKPGHPIKRFHYKINSLVTEPETVEDALDSDDCESWKHSMQQEYLSQLQNNTWTLVKKPEDKKILSMKWVFRLKTDEDGNVERFKSRLCVKGCAQKFGVDYEETFAPVIKYFGIRLMLAMALNGNLEAHHVDIETAYLNSDVDEEIYVHQPEQFV